MRAAAPVVGLAALVPAAIIAGLAVPYNVGEMAAGRFEHLVPFLLLDVGLLGGLALAAWGFLRQDAGLALLGALLLAVAGVVLMLGASGFPVLLSVALVVLAARTLPPPGRGAQAAVRILTGLAGAAVLGLSIASWTQGHPPAVIDLVFWAIVAAFVAVAWLPWPASA